MLSTRFKAGSVLRSVGNPSVPRQQILRATPDTDETRPPSSETPTSGTRSSTTVTQNGTKIRRPDGFFERFRAKELVDEVFKSDEFLKRGEEYFFFQVLLLAALVFVPAYLESVSQALGSVSLVSGLLIIALSANDLGPSLFPFPKPREGNELVTGGLYAYARHPMYSGVLLAGLGAACSTESASRFILLWLLFFVLDRKADLEEKGLAERHGTAYTEYKERTRRFFPGLY